MCVCGCAHACVCVCVCVCHLHSCSTTWYSLAYTETVNGGVHKGERILQLGVGGGMKVGINVWRALRDVHVPHGVWKHVMYKPLTGEECNGCDAVHT